MATVLWLAPGAGMKSGSREARGPIEQESALIARARRTAKNLRWWNWRPGLALDLILWILALQGFDGFPIAFEVTVIFVA